MTLEENPTSCARRVLARDAVVELIDTGSKKDRGSEGVFFPCTSTTHIKSMLFIHVIIAYYTFAAAGHEAPLSSLFSLKKYLNLKKVGGWGTGKSTKSSCWARLDERVFFHDRYWTSEASKNERAIFLFFIIRAWNVMLRNLLVKNLKT